MSPAIMSRNPYENVEGAPQLRRSVFVFMDILGYENLTRVAELDGAQQELLQRLHSALSKERKDLEGKHERLAVLKKLTTKDRYALKAFTDNIVIAWPIIDDAEIELGSAFSKVAWFQFNMALEGFFIRGAISIGEAYVDDIVVFGDALTQAHTGESRLARDPRIILTESAVTAVKQHLNYYSSSKFAPQVRELLQDSDGQWSVNYLETILIAEDEHGPFYEEFRKHKTAVETRLAQHRDNPLIFSKYVWVAGYHNCFCDLYSRYFSNGHKIDTELFRATPKLIVDE
jgi:hypothetical protein